LRRELLRLQREKDDDNDFLNEKIRQLKRQLQNAVSEKEEAVEEAKQMEIQKIRLEKLLKSSLGKGDGSPDDVI
jgi:cell division protein ZapA (FtsZ GTPase activity inhibitor)